MTKNIYYACPDCWFVYDGPEVGEGEPNPTDHDCEEYE
jgi:hypothetical protein